MKYIILLSCIGMCAQSLWAEDGTITKYKGNKAVVEFSPGARLHVGDTVHVGSSSSNSSFSSSSFSSSSGSSPSGDRDHMIAFSANLLSGSLSPGGSHSLINVTGRYGWNKVTMEYGPEASLYSESPGSKSAISVGGFFDYNLVPNSQGKVLVYGVGGNADIGTASPGSATTMGFFGGGFVKWFPLGNTVAVRGDGGLGYTRTAADSTTTTDTALVVRGALEVYF